MVNKITIAMYALGFIKLDIYLRVTYSISFNANPRKIEVFQYM